jgi:hypothetical protein
MGLDGSEHSYFRAGVVSAMGREQAHMWWKSLPRRHFRSDAEQSTWRETASDTLHVPHTLCNAGASISRSRSYEKTISDLELVAVPPQRR